MANLFLGKFENNGVEYEVTEADYLSLPDDIEADLIIKAAKRMAIIRHTKQHYKPKKVDSPISSEFDSPDYDPIKRFTSTAIIFDGNNLAHKCRHTFNLSHKGIDVSVVYGVLKVMQAIIRSYADVKLVAVCWDYGIPQFRKATMPEYKATRSHDGDDTYADFLRQVRLLDDMLPYFGVLSLRLKNCEADDMMAALSSLTNGDCLNVLVSSDKDLLQCINYHTVVSNGTKTEDITIANFEVKVGVKPADYLTYRALCGDGSDNLAGVSGVGDKTALGLIEAYSSPSNIINVACGKNTEAQPMSNKLAAKLQQFGLKGFGDMFTVMRLDYDRCGARSYIIDEFNYWEPYNATQVVGFLKKWLMVSLMDPQFYELFKQLEDPRTLLMQDLGTRIRVPVPNLPKSPIEFTR